MSGILQIEVEYFLLCISTLFALMNPLGIVPIFVIMTEHFDHESRKSIAKKKGILRVLHL
jgi:small neutral amino acid transporter SnatA (MarC family)